MKDHHHLLSVEAARVVSQSPVWRAGLERGKVVNVFSMCQCRLRCVVNLQ